VPSAIAGEFLDQSEIPHTRVALPSLNVRAKRRDQR
jgi:hypothetical protein